MNHGIGQVPQVYSLTILGSTNAILSLAEIPQYISSGNISRNAAIAIFQLMVGHCTLRSTNTCTGSRKTSFPHVIWHTNEYPSAEGTSFGTSINLRHCHHQGTSR